MVFTTVDREFNTVWEIIYVRWHFECSHKKLYNKFLSAWVKLSHRFLLTLKLQYQSRPCTILGRAIRNPLTPFATAKYLGESCSHLPTFLSDFLSTGKFKMVNESKVKWKTLSFFLQPPPFSFTEKWQTKAWNRRKNVYVAV